MKMRALQSFVYAGRLLKTGETFELKEANVEGQNAVYDVLTTAGLAEDATAAPPKKPRGRYKRRDLRADDE